MPFKIIIARPGLMTPLLQSDFLPVQVAKVTNSWLFWLIRWVWWEPYNLYFAENVTLRTQNFSWSILPHHPQNTKDPLNECEVYIEETWNLNSEAHRCNKFSTSLKCKKCHKKTTILTVNMILDMSEILKVTDVRNKFCANGLAISRPWYWRKSILQVISLKTR